MAQATSALGLAVFLLMAWGLSENRRHVPWRVLFWGLGLQFALGVLLLRTGLRAYLFEGVRVAFDLLRDATNAGASFVFGDATRLVLLREDAVLGEIVDGDFAPVGEPIMLGSAVAFQVLPVIIFVSALAAIFYHLRVIQLFVYAFAWLMRRTLRTSGAETLGAALLIFIGIEAVSAVRGYLGRMTRSELCTIMTTFMATIAGSVMIIYASFGAEPGHLLTASLMSAPAAFVISKLMVPETRDPETAGGASASLVIDTRNVVDAASQGTRQGLAMALNVAAMLIVFIGLVFLLDAISMAVIGRGFASILGAFFVPFAWLMGVSGGDARILGELLGTKTVFNEFLAYSALQGHIAEGTLSPRGITIATYALCGFANPGSIGIMIAGFDALAPARRGDISALALRAFVGGTLACFLTACVAGILL